ncbi:extracellular solute-binding protein [Actinopolymorpha alba]|uniref:extracellular solute-binding protein n=1 Tax=Actinopolymorpha alba TaxID=533267 RepID=UPI000379D440|nr:extracellular solute-binding protein [Actinopolymorpha alba]
MSPRKTLGSRPGLARVGLALAALPIVAAAACAPGGSSGDTGATTKPTGQIQTDPAKAGKATLTVWDINTSGGANDAMLKLNKEFEQKYPNIKINRVSRTLNDTKTTLKLALSGDNPPDVVQANQGYPDMGAFVKAGLLTSLDEYAKVYGWNTKYPKQLLDLNKFSTNGRDWQTGSLYGVSQTGEIVGIYYNKDLLTKVGVEVPKTFAEFEAALPKIKAAGEIPIQFGTSDKSPAIHLFGVVQAATAGKQAVRDLVTAKGNASWNDSGTTKAAQLVSDWARKGYLTSGANGLSGDAASANFAKGQGVFRIDGTWRLAELEKAMGDKVGFMSPPPAQAGQSSVTQGGEGLAWAVTSKSKNPDAAAAYLNFITNPHADDVLAETANLPAVAPPNYQPKSGTLTADIFGEWKKISENDGLVPYLDYTTPTFYDTLTANLQQLIGGKINVKQFTGNLEADYSAFKKSM